MKTIVKIVQMYPLSGFFCIVVLIGTFSRSVYYSVVQFPFISFMKSLKIYKVVLTNLKIYQRSML